MLRESPLRKGPQRIGEILVRRGWVKKEEIDYALGLQKESGVKRVGEILLGLGWLTAEQLSRAIAEQFQLEFLDLESLPPGWTLLRELYTWKSKHLRLLPLRDPEQNVCFVISELTQDQKLPLEADSGFDLSRIRFAIATTQAQLQVFNEHQAWDEPEDALPQEPLIYPTPPGWLRALQDPFVASPEPPPAEALAALGLDSPSAPRSPEELVQAARAATQSIWFAVPPALLTLSLQRLLTIVGALWGQSATEVRRSAKVFLQGGPRLRIEIARPAVAEARPQGGLPRPPAQVHAPAPIEVRVTIPWFCVNESSREPSWPRGWPAPDLAENLEPLLKSLCRIPPSLKTGESSLRWMGKDSPARAEVNRLTTGSIGVSLDSTRIDDVAELWSALLARARRLEANRVVRWDWSKWRGLRARPLEIWPGGILALASLAFDLEPEQVAGGLRVETIEGAPFSLELFRSSDGPAKGSGDLSAMTIRLTCPR
ncbi:MAG: hypothetical protein HY815_11130 [Candidatus Riflebacteria bacterium]|nr:hypothetical protein [Candidatus Riflebacteria bacterium]